MNCSSIGPLMLKIDKFILISLLHYVHTSPFGLHLLGCSGIHTLGEEEILLTRGEIIPPNPLLMYKVPYFTGCMFLLLMLAVHLYFALELMVKKLQFGGMKSWYTIYCTVNSTVLCTIHSLSCILDLSPT